MTFYAIILYTADLLVDVVGFNADTLQGWPREIFDFRLPKCRDFEFYSTRSYLCIPFRIVLPVATMLKRLALYSDLSKPTTKRQRVRPESESKCGSESKYWFYLE